MRISTSARSASVDISHKHFGHGVYAAKKHLKLVPNLPAQSKLFPDFETGKTRFGHGTDVNVIA